MTIDKSNLRQKILDFPGQFRVGLSAAENIKIIGAFDKVLICGMGGSALPADILTMWLEENKVRLPLHIHRNYGLPHFADKKHLMVCISYSGDTEETLSASREAIDKNLKIAAITSGGKLAELCRSRKIPLAIIPSGLPPRMALGLQFAALMKILANSGLIKNNLKEISMLENSLKPKASENHGKKIAENISGKIPLIYSSEKLKKLARLWKIKFNENTKIPAFSNYFPELNHNEHGQFEGLGEHFSKFKNLFSVIILRDPNDRPRILARMGLLAEILKTKKIQVNFMNINGDGILYRVFNSILLSDWISYYLALKYGIDPTPVRLNDEFKKRLTKGV